MSVVTYIRDKEKIKENLRYITHRSGKEKEKITRAIFTSRGAADKQEFNSIDKSPQQGAELSFSNS
jgi:predicted nucleotidyltransferase